MARMLRESLERGADDLQDRLLIEARVEAKRTMLALDAALKADGDLLDQAERQAIDAARNALQKAVDGPDRDAINAAVETLDTASREFAEKRMDRGIRQALQGVEIDRLATKVGQA
jgi:molecular chaperone HscA